MNIPMSWLKDFVNLDCTIDEFIHEMTMSGSKVEMVEFVGEHLKNIVVGEVLKIEKHPDADKLIVTEINIGEAENIQIVTGAKNVFEGAKVPVVLNGGVISDGTKIKTGKLRGVKSEGMMCSIEELGFSTVEYPEAAEDGIYIFDATVPVGADVCQILELKDEVVEYEITSNRPDCFSVYGIAREAAATFNTPLKKVTPSLKEEAEGDGSKMVSVEIANPQRCNRYKARIVTDIKIEPSPQWMRHRLAVSGIRPINNIVDITNYVMLELGQPMHAFSIENVKDSKIIVRDAKDGEVFKTLDGEERKLDSSMLVIADPEKALAIAGVMGGENSMITEGTKAVLFESANFDGPNVRLTSKKLGLRTDSSSKFEKGLDPNLVEIALDRALELVELLGCGKVMKGAVDVYPNKVEKSVVEFSADSVNRLLGTDITKEAMTEYLGRLEIEVKGNTAIVPTFRPDVETEADISEEVARIYGYDKIPETLATGTPTAGKISYTQNIENIIKTSMVALGLSEAMNYSFESPKVFDKLTLNEDNPLRNCIKVANPLGEDFSVMRTTTVNGILQSLANNFNKRTAEAKIFEVSTVYIPKQLPITELPVEQKVLAIGMYGKYDFYNLKGILEELFEILGLSQKVKYEPLTNVEYLHPGQSAKVLIDGEELGYLGAVHPAVLENYEIGKTVFISEINIDKIFEKAVLVREYKPLPKFPASERDLAILVDENILVGELQEVIYKKGGKNLENVVLFDIYQGEQIKDGFKSVAFSLSFRAGDRTLTEAEVSEAVTNILATLEEKFDCQLRG